MSMCLSRCISPVFAVLVDVIKEQSDNATQVLCSKITPVLKQRDPFLYEKAGVPGFTQYIKLALAAGVITQGGKGALRWISLLPSIQYADFLASAPARSESIFSSSTSFNFSFPVTSCSPREVNTSAGDPSVPERELDKPAQLEPVTTSMYVMSRTLAHIISKHLSLFLLTKEPWGTFFTHQYSGFVANTDS
jgi:hypothetical protein